MIHPEVELNAPFLQFLGEYTEKLTKTFESLPYVDGFEVTLYELKIPLTFAYVDAVIGHFKCGDEGFWYFEFAEYDKDGKLLA